jgi:hypothetical protein
MSNNLTGPLPDEWSGMRGLRYLWVAAGPGCVLQGLAVCCRAWLQLHCVALHCIAYSDVH